MSWEQRVRKGEHFFGNEEGYRGKTYIYYFFYVPPVPTVPTPTCFYRLRTPKPTTFAPFK